MFTIEANQMEIIIKNVHNKKAKKLFYHMLINYEIYKTAVEAIDKNMDKLNFYNFAKTQTCHMNDGLFGQLEYEEYQFVYQLKVIGNLIVLITSGHRIMTCIGQAQSIEISNDWKTIRRDIQKCKKIYSDKLRNFMEHLEEKICNQELTNQNCQFSPERILYCKDEKTNERFDFNNEQLEIIDNLINDVLKMLSARGKA